MRLKLMSLGLLALAGFPLAHGEEPVKPPAPPSTVPDMRTTKAVALCVNCDAPFDGKTHRKVLEGLLSNPYVGELRKALFLQDSFHQFESRVHFDNCDFDSSVNYIDALLVEAGQYVDAAQKAQADGGTAATQAAARKAFFAIGQALHGVQDFYAHSNYVELTKQSVTRVTDLEVVAPWRAEGKARIKQLQQQGLVSGYVFWGVPQRCLSGAASHADLAKDSETTTSGKVKVAHLENLSQYRIAVFLAREASQELLRDAFKRWPLLKELNGQNVAFEVLLDRRGL